jgi:hypothetical protein
MALVLTALFVGDHPALTRGTTRVDLILDRAHPDETSLRAHVERLLGDPITDLVVRKIDLVNDTTWVSVRRCARRTAIATSRPVLAESA